MTTVTTPSLALVPYIHINRLVVELQRSRVYTFPPLNDCRGQFADMMQQNIKWDGPENWEVAVVVKLKTPVAREMPVTYGFVQSVQPFRIYRINTHIITYTSAVKKNHIAIFEK